jgi:hypothetical protein
MTYFPDLTPYTYALTNDNVDASVLNVGWLDISAPYAVGVTSQEFQKKILDFCVSEYIVLRCLGYHECQYCVNPPWPIVVQHQSGRKVELGNGEIRVIGKSVIYASPTLIYHYVSVHSYRPPDEFVEAVLNGPHAGSDEQKAILAKLHR